MLGGVSYGILDDTKVVVKKITICKRTLYYDKENIICSLEND